jgi:chloramphenicol 3-O phosphotransferase
VLETEVVTGRLTALIGPSSVGKSSVAQKLQQLLVDPHLVVGLDDFFSMFPHHWADHPRGPGPGFWYEDDVEDGSPRARIRYGDAGRRLLTGMRGAVRALLDAGNDLILDEMPIDKTILPAWRRDLSAYPTYWVLLTAPLPVLEERERGRPSGRHLGNARGHHWLTELEGFDLLIDTAELAPSEVAARIVASRLF